MNLRIVISLIFLILFSCRVVAEDIFDLAGKSIMLAPPAIKYENSVYNCTVLKNYKFPEQALSNLNIFGKIIKVERVEHINKGKKDEAVLVVINVEKECVVLYLPMRFPDKSKALYTLYNTQSTLYFSVLSSERRTNPLSYQLVYYDALEFQNFEERFKNKTIRPVKNIKNVIFDNQQAIDRYVKEYGDNSIYSSVLCLHAKYDCTGLKFSQSSNHMLFKPLCVSFLSNNKEINVPLLAKGRSYKSSTLRDFSLCLETDEEFIFNSKAQYDSIFIQELSHKYIGKEIYSNCSNTLELIGNSIYAMNSIYDMYPTKNYNIGSTDGYFTCYDIRLMKPHEKDKYFKYYAILKDSTQNLAWAFPVDENFEKYNELGYIHREKEKQQLLRKQEEEQQRINNIKKEEQQYSAELIRKYGKRNAKLIEDGEVRIGFTKEMCIESWGEPYSKNITQTRYGKREQWVYGIGSYLYFQGNKLIGIQDTE